MTKKRKKFDFNTQLSTGDVGEKDFQKYYSELNPEKSAEDLKYDFKLINGDTLELKTDTYDMDATPNFFMEYYSDMRKMKVGGPWRAFQDEVDVFVYYFLSNRTFFWFRTKTLHEALEKYISESNPRLKSVPNKGWITQGFTVPREILTPVILKKDIF
jgi:hypothetical protein